MQSALRITLPQHTPHLSTSGVLPLTTAANDAVRTFELPVTAYLKDACPYQNVYFARYFDWQGMVRESFLSDVILADTTFNGIFFTKCAHQEFIHETFPHERLTIFLNTFQVQNCSLFLLFRFMVDDMLVGTGYQQIVCAGANRKPCRFPKEIYSRSKEYEISADSLALTH